MIDRIIDFSARNKFLVFLVGGVAVAAGWWSLQNMPLDAIPDLSDTQVIVYSRWDRSPDIMEDQVTYPIVTAMLGAPHVKDVRGFSDFGYSYVYIIFEEGTDIYWARSRTLEYLSSVTAAPAPGRARRNSDRMPPALAGSSSTRWSTRRASRAWRTCAPIRTGTCATTWRSVPGVAEVAPSADSCASTRSTSIPTSCRRTTFPSMKVVEAVRGGNNDVGGRLVEFSGPRVHGAGRGYAQSHRRPRKHRAGGEPRAAFPSA